jgi:predicted PurR-regulated permease PerM
MDKANTFNIPWGTIIRIALGILLFYTLYLIRGVLLYFIFSAVIAVLFDPINDLFQKKLKLPRTLAVLFSYFLFLSVIIMLLSFCVPVLSKELLSLNNNSGYYFSQISQSLKYIGLQDFDKSLMPHSLNDLIAKVSGDAIALLGDLIGLMMSALTVLSLSIFISLDEEGVDRGIKLLLPKKSEDYLFKIWQDSKKKVALWFQVRILTSVFLSIATFLFCNFFLKTEYALLFSVIVGLADFIPVIGPIIATVIIGLMLLTNNANLMIYYVVFSILLQQIESNMITPYLSKKLMGLSPVLVLLAVLIGGKLWGAVGAFLAIPLIGLVIELLKDFLRRKKEENYE